MMWLYGVISDCADSCTQRQHLLPVFLIKSHRGKMLQTKQHPAGTTFNIRLFYLVVKQTTLLCWLTPLAIDNPTVVNVSCSCPEPTKYGRLLLTL